MTRTPTRLRRLVSRVPIRLPQRTVRARLTLLYGGLFFAAGAGLLAVTYVLVEHTTAVRIRAVKGGHQVITSTAPKRLSGLAAQQRAIDLHHLLVNSGIALAIMAVAALALGWLIAGHVLRPLRTIISTTQQISAHNLHERLDLPGPTDELKHIADTIDGLLDRLQAAFTAQRHFIANASHELRTPLTYDRTLLEVTLADPHASNATLRAACTEILTSQTHQERLIEALLTLASSERGLETQESVDLAAVTGPIATTRRPVAESAGLHFDARLNPAPVAGDPRLIERLVINLIDNAIAHNTTSGWVEILTGTRAGHAFLAIANTGPIVRADEIDRLLQPFQRLDAARTYHPDGHGLGLSIVAAIATAHQATLTARPNPRGGLDIEVSFPAAQSNQTGAAEQSSLAIGPRPRPDRTLDAVHNPPLTRQ